MVSIIALYPTLSLAQGDSVYSSGEEVFPASASLMHVSENNASLNTTDEGIQEDDWEDDDEWEEEDADFDFSGFIETRIGLRLQNDPYQKSFSLGELRLKTEFEKEFENFTFKINSNFIFDPVMSHYKINLETGQGFMDLREMHISFSPADFIDVKVGRQILTWGTGDLLFINDLFSKDWRSFFNGRSVEYLKAPSDALKTSFFFDFANFDIVYTPRFDADRFIDGKRLSFLNSGAREAYTRSDMPDRWFKEDEISVRAYRSFGTVEAALYYYHGFTKSPAAMNPQTQEVLFPKLSVYGASLRTAFYKGILNLEIGQRNITPLNDPSTLYFKKDEFRFLIGYEQEIASELTAAVQYYIEIRPNETDSALNSDRHLTSIRLTKFLLQQKLTLSFFGFYSPSDGDGYIRLNTSYKVNDDLKIELGSNLFLGSDRTDFFTQFKDNNNLYIGVRYSF